MRILVTGSDGMVGKRLVKHLKSKYDVIEFGNDKDIRNWDDWISIYNVETPINFIIHLAALVSVHDSLKNPELFNDVNVNGTRNMLKFSELDGANILYASSSNVYEWWVNPYAATKKINEIQCENYPAIGMRFYNIWPGRDDMLFMKLKNNRIKYINKNHSRDFIHVDDIVSAIQVLISNFNTAILSNRVYDIGTGHSTPVEQVANVFDFNGEWRDINPVGECIHTIANIDALLNLGWTPKWNILNHNNSTG